MAAIEPISLLHRGFGQFIVREANGYRSREQAKVAGGSGKLVDGAVLGRITTGAPAVPSQANVAGIAGNGTLAFAGGGGVDAGAAPGVYRAVFYAATKFQVFGPGGEEVGRGTTGVAFDGPVNFTITAGGTPFAVGDTITITVAFAAGSFAYAPYDPDATDGTQRASAILFGNIDATDEEKDIPVTICVRDAEVQTAGLAFAAGVDAGEKEIAYASLAAAGIAFR